MSATKKSEAKAEKALKAAAKAVKKAQHAAQDASKKAQKKADQLAAKLGDVKTTRAESQKPAPVPTATNAGTKSASGAIVTPPLPHAKATPPTLVELREQAKIKKIVGYSRLNKTALIEALR